MFGHKKSKKSKAAKSHKATKRAPAKSQDDELETVVEAAPPPKPNARFTYRNH